MSVKMVCVKQRDVTDCGAACLVSIAASYGTNFSVSKVRQTAGTDKCGTSMLGMVEAATKMGFNAKAVRAGIEVIRQIPLPSIAHVLLENGLQHFVVLYSIKREQLVYMDPATGTLVKSRHSDFSKIWTGVLLLLEPSGSILIAHKTKSTKKRIYDLLTANGSLLLQGFIGALVYTLLGLSLSIYIQKLVDTILVDGDLGLLNLVSIMMIFLLCIQQYTGTFKTLLGLQVGQRMDATLISHYLRHLLKLPQFFFDTMRKGEVLSRINDAVMIRNFVSDTVMQIVVNLLILICSFLVMFLYSIKLALMMLLLLPIYGILYYLSNKINRYWQRKLMEKGATMETELVGTLQASTTIKRFGLEEVMIEKNESGLIALLRTVYDTGIRNIALSSVAEFVTRFFTLLILWIGSILVIEKALTPGTLLSFYSIIGYFTGPVLVLIGTTKSFQEAMIAADRLFEIMELEPEEASQVGRLPQSFNEGDIVFDQVGFRYGSRQTVFNELSFQITVGSCIGIAGESGSGKSTLLHLLLRLYPIQKGHIYIGGVDINDISLPVLREKIAVVPQDTDILSGTVLENICLNKNIVIDDVIQLCQQVGLDDFIRSLPEGYHTVLQEQGSDLSGGQKQKIGIVRALYRRPSVLLLDEATASLDTISESAVQECLQYYRRRGVTIMIVAHRLTTLQFCDEILVLQDGKLIERGSHDELIQQLGLYATMWDQR
ncbi:peptidase domain-containing ABC transporter [Sediminibacterium sp. KACHI17]|uniref:Peptidase domain-containing ABC transporter n=1 Tax=Sediminibacterium sp. KACHI17 TaxID=1751071 RepID=A0AAT9GLA2_9BACT